MKSMASEHKTRETRCWFSGFGTGPKAQAVFEIHGLNYTVSVLRDKSVYGMHKNHFPIVDNTAFSENGYNGHDAYSIAQKMAEYFRDYNTKIEERN
jgi:hypothetical protein